MSVKPRLGPVQGKQSWRSDQPPIFTPEYEDCARVARAQGIPLRDVFAQVQKAYTDGTTQP